MGPARSTVLGNVLVLDVGQVVHSIDVVPDPLVGKSLRGKCHEGLGDLVCGDHIGSLVAWVFRVNVFEGGGVSKHACGGERFHRSK